MMELQSRGIPYNYIDSGQHAELTMGLRKVFNIAEPNYLLSASDADITKISKAVHWFLSNLTKGCMDRTWLNKYVFPKKGICLIHGDTLSTLLGAFMAILAGVKVCHIEAGLRSYKWFDPFPEEIIRLICMRFSKILFAPSKKAFNNLVKLKVNGEKYILSGNTVIDSIRYIKNRYEPQAIQNEKYALATCHRLETISDRNKLSEVINLLNRVSNIMHVIFVMHKPTRTFLKKFGFLNKLSKQILIKDMIDYPQFLSLITLAEMVLTDGGSIQEECAYLNKKCLVIRNKTERDDGVGQNAMLWGFDEQKTEQFLKWKIADKYDSDETLSPSKEIVDYLISADYY